MDSDSESNYSLLNANASLQSLTENANGSSKVRIVKNPTLQKVQSKLSSGVDQWTWSALDVTEEDSKSLKLSIDGWLNLNSLATTDSLEYVEHGANASALATKGEIIVNLGNNKVIHFLTNWTDLWRKHEQEVQDEFGQIAPLFHDFVEFYGHRGAIIGIAMLVLYYIITQIVIAVINPDSANASAFNIIAFVLLYLLYLSGLAVYKGSLSQKRLMQYRKKEVSTTDDAKQGEGAEAEEEPKKVARTESDIELDKDIEDPSIWHLFKKMFRRFLVETYWSDAGLCFRNLLGVSKVGIRKIGCCQRFSEVLPDFQPISFPQLNDEGKPLKKPNFYMLMCMAIHFINKGGSKRYQPPKEFQDGLLGLLYVMPILFIINYATYWKQVTDDGCFLPEGHGNHIPPSRCHARIVELAMSLGYFTHWLMTTLLINGCLLILFGLIYGADIAHSLSKHWYDRFKTLRRIRSTDAEIEDNPAVIDDEVRRKEYIALNRMLHIMPFVRRDAYERYIFIHELMLAFGKSWRILLTALLILSGAQIIYGFYILFSEPISGYIAATMAGAILLFLFPVYCLAYTNSAVDTINHGFAYAAPEDFEALGGRDTWLQFTGESPLYWYIFGFAITRSWLIGFIGGIVTATIVTIGSAYASSIGEGAAESTT